MAGAKIPGKCFADFVVGVNWFLFIVTAIFFGALIGYFVGYVGASNVLVNRMAVGEWNRRVDKVNVDPDTNLTEEQNAMVVTIAAILGVVLLIQFLLNLLLNRGVRQGNIRQLYAWLVINWILFAINTLGFIYKLSGGRISSSEDVLGSLIGLIWFGISIFAINYYRNNVILVRTALPEVAVFPYGLNPEKIPGATMKV